jgi:hypothetical protein
MIGWFDPIMNFMHELLHFQFIHYWNTPGSVIANLDNDKFNWLKESLTVVLDKSLYPLTQRPDWGYEIHREYREKLHKFWETNKNFDDLVQYGMKILPKTA